MRGEKGENICSDCCNLKMSTQLRHSAEGRLLKKQFANPETGQLEWYPGRVMRYNSSRRLYWIKYDDGDEEELAWRDLQKLLLPVGSEQLGNNRKIDETSSAAAPLDSELPDTIKIHPLGCDLQAGNVKKAAASESRQEHRCDVHQGSDQARDCPGQVVTGSKKNTARKTCLGLTPVQSSATELRLTPQGHQQLQKSNSATAQDPLQQQQQQRQVQESGDQAATRKQPAAKGKKQTAGEAAAAAAAAATQPSRKRKKQQAPKRPATAAGTPDEAAKESRPKKLKKQQQQQQCQPDIQQQQQPGTEDKKLRHQPSGHWGVERRENASLAVNEAARLLFQAYWQQAQAVIEDTEDAVNAAEAAEAVVLAPCNKKPLWEATADGLPIIADADVGQHLAATATNFGDRQPYKRFTVPTSVIQQFKQQLKASDSAVAAACNSSPAPQAGPGRGSSSSSNRHWQCCPAAAKAQEQGPRIFVADKPFADAHAELARAVDWARKAYWSLFRVARVSEAERVSRITGEIAAAVAAAEAAGQPPPSFKKPSTRPDRVAESQMMETKLWGINDRTCWGYMPGLQMNTMTQLRSEAKVLGIHGLPMGGIACGEIPVAIETPTGSYKEVKAATCLVMAGIYEDDHDTAVGDIITYTGEGGNDLNGNKRQMKDQELKSGNQALLVNLALGLPVRLLRKNEGDSATGVLYYFDGLYDVVSFAKTRGVSGFVVFKYGLRRRPGQEQGLSKHIPRFKGVGAADTRKAANLTVKTRAAVVCRDLSKGKEPLPLVVVNEVDRELPPGLQLPEDQEWLVEDDVSTAGPLVPCRDQFRYITANEYAEGVEAPQPPRVEEWQDGQQRQQQRRQPHCRAGPAATSDLAATSTTEAADGRPLPSVRCSGNPTGAIKPFSFSTSCRDVVLRRPGESPHELLKRVNFGRLPYQMQEEDGKAVAAGAAVSKRSKKAVAVAVEPSYVLTECGAWTGCTDGDCQQKQTGRGLTVRLEVFKTKKCGWGVRSWDRIMAGQLVAVMWGKVHRVEDIERLDLESSYFFDMAPRADFDESNRPLSSPREHHTKFVVCSKEQGSVARFINHSCKPNLYVQPICGGHTDPDMVAVGLFAWHDIPPFIELAYDYGESYIEHNLEGTCFCGTDCCKFKPPVSQP